MRSNIEAVINTGWTQVGTLKASVTDSNIVKLNFLLQYLPEAEDHLLAYRTNELAVARLNAQIATEQAKPAPDVLVISQFQAELRRAQGYMLQADARIEVILYQYGKL